MSSDEWKRKNTIQINIRLVKQQAETIALTKATEDKHCTIAEFSRIAIREKLIREGYLPETPKAES